MSLISRLRSQRSGHYASIEVEQEKLSELEALYSSLQQFHTNVKQKNSDFFSANKNLRKRFFQTERHYQQC